MLAVTECKTCICHLCIAELPCHQHGSLICNHCGSVRRWSIHVYPVVVPFFSVFHSYHELLGHSLISEFWTTHSSFTLLTFFQASVAAAKLAEPEALSSTTNSKFSGFSYAFPNSIFPRFFDSLSVETKSGPRIYSNSHKVVARRRAPSGFPPVTNCSR